MHYEISANWMKACGKGNQPKVVRIIRKCETKHGMTALIVDMGEGEEWTVIAEWRGKYVD